MKKSLLIAMLVCAAVCGTYAQKRFVMLDKVVAVVGNSSITYSDVEQLAGQLVEQRRSEGYTSDRDPKNEALEHLLMQKLLYNQALIDSVSINNGDVLQRVESQIQALIEDAGSITALEKKNHMAIYHIRELLRRRFEEQSYAAAMQNEVVSKITVVPGEVERYYRNIDKDSLPIIAEQYVYAHITKFPDGIDAAKRRTRERLIDMRERIVTGKTKFSVLARMYSVDPSAIRGGELEPMQAAGFVKPFADALEELKPGQVSEVVETEFGFHLIQLIDKKGQMYHCRHILLRPTYSTEEITAPLLKLDSIAGVIRADSISFEKAAAQFSDDQVFQDERRHRVQPRLVGTLFGVRCETHGDQIPQRGFRYRRRKEYRRLQCHTPTESGRDIACLPHIRPDGNDLCKTVKLVEIIPAHAASLDEDYLRLEQMALSDKQQKAFKEWLDRKIDAMYVYIAPEFRDGEFENRKWVEK